MTQRYHKAARDGLLDILKETTRKDCNAGDEDGMTPTLWAAFEGNLEALSLLVGRGGDPSKCDHFGNTALHLASAKGHMDCVKFLVNFGANIFSLDIDMHTPKELAAMNDCQEILRYLDDIAADQELQNAKKVKTLQEKAEKEAQKLMKNFKKIQKKADKLNEKEKKLLDKEMQKLEISSSDNATDLDGDSSNSSASTGNGSSNGVTTISGGSGGFTKFSEITNNNNFNSSSSNGKKLMGTVSKKLNLKKSQAKVDGSSAGSVPTFTISEVEDGKRSMRHLKGRRQSANVLFVPKNLEPIEDKEDELLDVKFPNPLFHQNQRKSIAAGMTGGASMFDRPGMGGSIAFRNSMTATLFSFNKNENNTENSIGSAGSLVNEDDDEDQVVHEELPPFSEADFAPVAIFLAGLGMEDWISVFKKEEIDIHALTLLQEEDLKSMGLALGPRKKVITAIEDRRKAMKEDQLIQDSQL